jgi:putative exporter of polyketide antibiotics
VSQINISEEFRKAPVEPLLPVEKNLIGWSLGIGVVLLVLLAIVNHLFPASI